MEVLVPRKLGFRRGISMELMDSKLEGAFVHLDIQVIDVKLKVIILCSLNIFKNLKLNSNKSITIDQYMFSLYVNICLNSTKTTKLPTPTLNKTSSASTPRTREGTKILNKFSHTSTFIIRHVI